MAIYNQIGQTYDTTRRADPYIVSRLAYHLDIDTQKNYLDLACGTGNYTIALAAKGGSWHGIDQSSQMIKTARAKSDVVNWRIASITSLSFSEGTFSGAVCTLAIHHFPELPSAFREVRRVLSGGNFIVFTSTPEQTGNYWLAEYFPEAIRRSAEQMPKLETVIEALQKAGFTDVETENYQVREDLQDFFLYSGKYQPEIYLEPQVRANISTFSLLAEQSEVELGCERLASDIKTGRIQQIIERHKRTNDYLFVVAKV
jgi:ubiquinone/menaquinone biosynthesis C-methylase UbiE